MKFWNRPYRKIGAIVLLSVVTLVSIGFVGVRYEERICKAIVVNIDNQYENYFISEGEVINMITHQEDERIVGVPFSQLDLRRLEMNLSQNKYVQNAEVFKDLKGNLIVTINQSRPVARLISRQIKDRYISNYGEVLPVSDRYTARVLLITGPYADNPKLTDMNQIVEDREVFNLIHFITEDPFWKSQIAELEILRNGEVNMYTQVSKQKVEFGQPEDIEEKFRNLKIFYKRILPAKGWNSYNRVSVKFKNQIVCE